MNSGTGAAGGAMVPPTFLKIGGKVILSNPNITRLVSNALQKFISTPNILLLSPGLSKGKKESK